MLIHSQAQLASTVGKDMQVGGGGGGRSEEGTLINFGLYIIKLITAKFRFAYHKNEK